MNTKTQKQSLNNALQSIEDAANSADTDMRYVHVIDEGQVVRQGDIYLARVRTDHPRGEPTNRRQLAVGTTRGSRHVAEAPAVMYIGTTAPPGIDTLFLGPCFVVPERARISHPTHADVSLPMGTYQVWHQLDPRRMARVAD